MAETTTNNPWPGMNERTFNVLIEIIRMERLSDRTDALVKWSRKVRGVEECQQ